MKILYFHQHFSTPKGSAGIRSYAMACKLVDHGHEVVMVCGSYGGGQTGLTGEFVNNRRQGNVDGIEIIELNLAYSNKDGFIKRGFTFIKFAAHSVIIALTKDYDLVFATTTPLTAGIPGIFAHWLKGKKFVFEVRDLWPELPKAMGVITNPVILALMYFLEWASYRSANRLIGLSPGIVEGITARGVLNKNIAMIPNGCDITLFNSFDQPWRPEGVNPSDLMAIFTGTHGIANGLDAVLDVAAVLKKRNRNDIKLVLVGEGKLKAELIVRAKELELENVIFHPPVNKANLANLMAAADIGMQILANIPAFYFGTSPNKFFDYISAGLPVLNNYPGWLAEMIVDNNCGYAVLPENPELFADALVNAADNKDELKVMGVNAKDLAVKKFDRNKLSAQFVDWLEGTQ
ncbi:glycosyltransferase family 4 protein [Methyloglobulus sp.]|uniref:glycosyltransferase family 4 protein n=1 Tax=Methyloglobulus sp. TaxID=2518622 RepID=UPI0032B7CD52